MHALFTNLFLFQKELAQQDVTATKQIQIFLSAMLLRNLRYLDLMMHA